jgi:hypothetical protein
VDETAGKNVINDFKRGLDEINRRQNKITANRSKKVFPEV